MKSFLFKYYYCITNRFLFPSSIFIFSLLAACGGGGGAGGSSPPPVATIATIEISPSTVTLAKTGFIQLSATARDSNNTAISGVAFTWSSDNPNILSVDSNGLASGLAEGTATITASAAGISKGASLQVKQIAAISISPADVTISRTGSRQFSATARDTDGMALSGATFTWSSDNPNIISINASGLASGQAEGTATITASADGIIGTTTVNVTFRLFSGPTNYSVGATPSAVAAGDFNNDGLVDLAVANFEDDSISLLSGAGSGLFSPAQTFSVGLFPQSIVAGRFNSDSFDDLAVSNLGDSTISIFLGVGTGIGSVTGVSSPGGPIVIVTSDLNSDGKQDLATANISTTDLSLILGKGDGSFQSPSPLSTDGNGSIAILATDVDNSGKPDLVAVSGDKITVLLDDGSGGFGDPLTIPLGTNASPNAIISADWNGDGNVDLAIVNSSSADLTLLFGDGNGGFSVQTQTISLGGHPEFAAVGDFNQDGKPDIVVTISPDIVVTNSADNIISILLNAGGGLFSNPVQQSTGGRPLGVVAKDLNGDGKDDIVVTNAEDNTISVFLQAGP